MCVANRLYWQPSCLYRDELEACPVTLIFALLRKDHIIFASDRRHVTGDDDGRYLNDRGWKTERVLDRTALLGFAGHDLTEQVVSDCRIKRDLEGDSLREIADCIANSARKRSSEFIEHIGMMNVSAPPMQFLLAGFVRIRGEVTATLCKIDQGSFSPYYKAYRADAEGNFEVIGRERHGALYALHRFAENSQSVEAGIQLAYFTLAEVSRLDTSVNGEPYVCVIRPNQNLKK